MSSNRWRWGTPLILILCGALFPISRANSDGDDLRPGRYTDLAALTSAEKQSVDLLTERAAALNDEVTNLTAGLKDVRVRREQRQGELLKDPAGLTERSGPGITVILSDAPEEVRASSTKEPNDLVVHQQDIQSVVNAMWQAGATAVTVAGQRIVSTTGISCEGNAVVIQDVPYPQPYVISAVGDQAAIVAAIDAQARLSAYRFQATDPEIAIGWQLIEEAEVVAPAFDGLIDISFATPMEVSDGKEELK